MSKYWCRQKGTKKWYSVDEEIDDNESAYSAAQTFSDEYDIDFSKPYIVEVKKHNGGRVKHISIRLDDIEEGYPEYLVEKN